ncbi:hypothetical protein [Paludisphaera rhizosphaerae]|nr:hypothetical protein [Paludisphaera rhizosphaerae]
MTYGHVQNANGFGGASNYVTANGFIVGGSQNGQHVSQANSNAK